MLQQTTPKKPAFFQIYQADHKKIHDELLNGLIHPQAFTSPKYLYNELGSKLFEAITCLPEYYPTRVEASIFDLHQTAICKTIPQGSILIDLGAGNCNKAARLFNTLNPSHYVAVDISVDFLKSALDCLQRQFPELTMSGVGTDFSSALSLPNELALNALAPRVLFYPGSSIGNFSPSDALHFLKQAYVMCKQHPDGGLLIGVDLIKDTPTLNAAYDDALGVTAAFNRNALLHINELLGTNFKIEQWKHIGFYNEQQSRIEMHLEAICDASISFHGDDKPTRFFAQGERIHTENSYKWTSDSFCSLLVKAGFQHTKVWTDPDAQFAVVWAN